MSWLKAIGITIAYITAAIFALVLVILLGAFIIESTLFIEENVHGLVAIAYLCGWFLIPTTIVVKKTML
jgi:hypothetical protein